MATRKTLVDRLHDDDLYRLALGKAPSDTERKIIEKIVEDFVGAFADALEPLVERANNDPEFARELDRALADGETLVNHNTGSHGS